MTQGERVVARFLNGFNASNVAFDVTGAAADWRMLRSQEENFHFLIKRVPIAELLASFHRRDKQTIVPIVNSVAALSGGRA